MHLFEQQGYAATTIPQITAHAGLTTRTFFRHFADKREVLFLRDREFLAVVRQSLVSLPAGLGPVELVREGLAAISPAFAAWREPVARRRAILAAEDQLRERELLKSARLGDAVSDALVERGVSGADARLLAPLSVLVFNAALDDWLDADDESALADHLASTWSRLAGLAAG
ncbi:AcrR family transcriptional regulator [Conyzicola lurida]|uniref:AcrR family transcriptional regulator n=1 Tax=Conyzicola lurida TaxID=1172621 RepID=A0A841AJZ6_9MICO|nr:TetR/AcrR family transcriptional regulator [Conyzicola lurida]MBB5842031.1 AcrR family transcriptional regulator [Conyzicola lurida]